MVVPRTVPENGGARGGVPQDVSGVLRAPGSGVPKVFQQCLQSTGARTSLATPCGTHPRLFGTLSRTSGPMCLTDSCSRPGGSQHMHTHTQKKTETQTQPERERERESERERHTHNQ